MDNIGQLIIYAAVTAFSFFVAAPITLNCISTFTVEKTFAEKMAGMGVITEADIKELHPKKQIAGLIVAAIVLGAIIFTSLKFRPFGLICFVFGFLLGILKYRSILQFNNLTVKRFQNTYNDRYDSNKLKDYINKTF